MCLLGWLKQNWHWFSIGIFCIPIRHGWAFFLSLVSQLPFAVGIYHPNRTYVYTHIWIWVFLCLLGLMPMVLNTFWCCTQCSFLFGLVFSLKVRTRTFPTKSPLLISCFVHFLRCCSFQHSPRVWLGNEWIWREWKGTWILVWGSWVNHAINHEL